jgi:hypothetical protein
VTSLRIRIAGRTLLVRSPARVSLSRAYARFAVARGADIVLDVRPGPLPLVTSPAVFESGGTWTAHAGGSGLV